jgi:hypothetical protein
MDLFDAAEHGDAQAEAGRQGERPSGEEATYGGNRRAQRLDDDIAISRRLSRQVEPREQVGRLEKGEESRLGFQAVARARLRLDLEAACPLIREISAEVDVSESALSDELENLVRPERLAGLDCPAGLDLPKCTYRQSVMFCE